VDRRTIEACIIELADANGGVVTVRQLSEPGLAGKVVRKRVAGLLTRAHQGVYVVGELTPDRLLRVALAAVPGAAASGGTAASLHRLPLPPPSRIEVVAPRLRHLVEHAITARLTTPTCFQACASAWCRRGRAGSRAVRAVDHELLDAAPVPASVLERRAVALLREAGLSGWQLQYRPPWYDGVRGIIDLAWPDLQVVAELDGRRWHATSQAQGEDRRRDRTAASHGWVTLRFGWTEVVHRPAAVIEECRQVLAARRRELAQADQGHQR
jgi:very-short-patch-repair endonuclease